MMHECPWLKASPLGIQKKFQGALRMSQRGMQGSNLAVVVDKLL